MDQRNSRTILSIGKDSLQRVQKGKFCIIGLNAIGTEIAKSLLLFGANFLTFVDNEKITEDDYKTNFYVKKENIGMERCKVISNNIKQINQYSKISYDTIENIEEIVKENDILCFTEPLSYDEIIKYELLCRKYQKGFIYCDSFSYSSFIFVDFGEQFVVENPYGLTPKTYKIKSITNANPGKITFFGKMMPRFKRGQKVSFFGLESMKELNGCETIEINTGDSGNTIIDTSSFSKYDEGNPTGFMREVIDSETVNFDTYDKCCENDQKFSSALLVDSHKVVKKFYINRQKNNDKTKQYKIPMCVLLGSLVANECIKYFTHQLLPLTSQILVLYYEQLYNINKNETNDNTLNFENEKLMIIGIGALGCELAKIASLYNIKGMTFIDPDDIELSNLNRQSLFYECDVGKNKAEAAKINILKRHEIEKEKIETFTQFVTNETRKTVFTNKFFKEHTSVFSLVDSFQGRTFIENCCAIANIPMFTGGIGSKQGDWTCSIPHVTERYLSAAEQSNGSKTPSCTLRNYPHTQEHCIEWAHNQLIKLINSKKDINQYKTIDDCINKAISYFQTKFNYNIRDLIYYHPKDDISNGFPFWSKHRIFPSPVFFSPKTNSMHKKLILSYTFLLAEKNEIKFNKEELENKMDSINEIKDEWKIPTIKKHGFDDENPENNINKTVSYKYQFDSTNEIQLDFIEACSNIRSENYHLGVIERINAMQHSANIQPTIPTINSIVSANIWLMYLTYLVNPKEVKNGSFFSQNLRMNRRSPTIPRKYKIGNSENAFTKWDFIRFKSSTKLIDAQNEINKLTNSELFSWVTDSGVIIPIVGSKFMKNDNINENTEFKDIFTDCSDIVVIEGMLLDSDLELPSIIIEF